jgi:hypothetical protein
VEVCARIHVDHSTRSVVGVLILRFLSAHQFRSRPWKCTGPSRPRAVGIGCLGVFKDSGGLVLQRLLGCSANSWATDTVAKYASQVRHISSVAL